MYVQNREKTPDIILQHVESRYIEVYKKYHIIVYIMIRHVRLLAKRQQQFMQTSMNTKQQPNTKKLPYQDFLKIYKWQNGRTSWIQPIVCVNLKFKMKSSSKHLV